MKVLLYYKSVMEPDSRHEFLTQLCNQMTLGLGTSQVSISLWDLNPSLEK